jgi:hypothetical protein
MQQVDSNQQQVPASVLAAAVAAFCACATASIASRDPLTLRTAAAAATISL